ncbi:MAG: DEAD/DEAH box helicase, partial [Saccharofermentanales bacterium]
MFVKVVLKNATIEFDKEYVYAVPPESEELIHEGSCVSIPFGRGNNEEKGYVISFAEDPGDGFYVKSIIKVYDPSPMLDNNQISLVRKMIKKYSCSYGDAIRLMLPPDTDAGKKRNSTIYLVDPEEAGIMASESDFSNINQLRVVEYLLEYGESLQNDVMTSCQVSKSTFLTLKKKNIVAFGKSVMHESPRIDDMKCDETSFQLTDDQTDALLKMSEADLDVYNEFLLYGVTGSGKTEVYLEMIRKNLMEGHGSILLVPEISLTPQMTARLENRFGDNVRVLHSRLTASERSRRWHDVLSGKAQIVAGARSAVFAPVKDLKLVIIDEEQESTYKS